VACVALLVAGCHHAQRPPARAPASEATVPDGAAAVDADPALERLAAALKASVTKPRTRSLVATEVQGLERLVSATPRSAPDRPALLRRLAAEYVELEVAADREDQTAVASSAHRKAVSTLGTLRDEGGDAALPKPKAGSGGPALAGTGAACRQDMDCAGTALCEGGHCVAPH
jgi:hypothetical protein